MPEPMTLRHHQIDPDDRRVAGDHDASRRAPRPVMEDPLEELARILGETSAYPARPETAAEAGRRGNVPARPMPQQLSALEAELFDELRASVTPEARVRGDFQREVTPLIPQHPVDDHDIASLRISPAPTETPELPRSAQGDETQWADFYAYDDGVAAGSYDPAFAHSPQPQYAPAQGGDAGRGARAEPGYPHPTFDDYGREEIAEAARESSPLVASEPRIMPHSRSEELAAARLPREGSGSGMKIVVAAIALMIAGGGAYGAWKMTGGSGSSDPVLVRADGKPMKVMPDPNKAPVADAAPSLTPDSAKGASKIVSLQEDPVDQVSGRTPEGKEVRLINPGAQRPASSDTPHTVKTVVVRPDGSIVTDGAPARAARPSPPAADAAPPPSAPPAAPMASMPQAPAPLAAAPMPAVEPPKAAAPSAPPPSAGVPLSAADTHMPSPKPAAAAPKPVAAPPQAAATPPAVAVPATPQVKTVAVTPVGVPKPVGPKPVTTTTITPPPSSGSSGAPMALGPVGPKLVSTASTPAPAPAAAAPRPVAAPPASSAPVAIAPTSTGGSGDYMVQISASGSDAAARSSFAAAQRKHPGLAGKPLDIQRADLGAKGVYYRARVPAGSRDQAAALCAQITSQGGQCMVVKR